ncbi:MAG: response regulator [Oscillatoriales cyanobacterium C42_A2020_001]|nr:response regulator [Leptolyngbyaceae cyanobacterium C42_A2020_001]
MMQAKSQIKVLIAERAMSVAEIIARNLRSQGYAIAGIVNSVEKAIEYATITVPDVVLLDLPMPGDIDVFMAGWQILNDLNCPVIYMTTQKLDRISESTALNSYGFLVKPFTADELTTTIDETLKRHALQRAMGDREDDTQALSQLDEDCWRLLNQISFLFGPLPRLYFDAGSLQIYADTVEDAQLLNQQCQDLNLSFPHQVFVQTWQDGDYLPYSAER